MTGGEVHLACRDLELRGFRELFLIGGRSLEVSVDDVFRSRDDLAQVGRVPVPRGLCNDQPLVLHQPLQHLFGDGDVSGLVNYA